MSTEDPKPNSPRATPLSEPSHTGRTAWDFATEAIRSPAALVLVLLLAFVLPLTVHYFAEPGSEVSIYNLIKYKKAADRAAELRGTHPSPAVVQASAPAPTPDSYYLPAKVRVADESVTPILDRTINVQPIQTEANKTTCRLGGANLSALKAGARQLNGASAKLESSGAGGPVEITAKNGCYFEIEYRSLFFSIELVDVGYPDYELTVARKLQPTLSLAPPPLK
jgi:hypothetical protein